MTEADFLKSILQQPDDDITRLAYADWLMERGDDNSSARGEFIQVQIQLANRTESGGNPADWVDVARVPELKVREQELLLAHGGNWAKPVATLVDAYVFHKGFIEHVTLAGSKFLLGAEQLFKLAPIQRVRLTGGLTPAVYSSAFFGKLSGLDFSRGHIGDHGLRHLLASTNLANLNWLDLSHCYLTNRGAQSLAEAKLLAQLDHLNLSNNSLGLEGVQTLFKSPYWGKVRTLLLAGNRNIDSRAQEFLLQSMQGEANPALLRSILQLSSREEREYTNVHVRELAQRAGQDPAVAPRVLGEALGDARRKVRSAAAQMVARLGVAGVPALPKMVQRLFEGNLLTRDQVAPSLARLLPHLPTELEIRLCQLANPLMPAQANLRAVLVNPKLPAAVREGFAAVCARRAAWWARISEKATESPPVPVSSRYRLDLSGVEESVTNVLDLAEKHASRHYSGAAHQKEGESGRVKEAAWMLARLTELFQATVPADEPPPAPVKKGRKRK